MGISELRKQHREAMEIYDQALNAKRHGDIWGFQELSIAFDMEWEVVQKLEGNLDRAVFSRSASWLAIHAKRYDDAQTAITYGLSGEYVPEEIAQELQEAQAELNRLREVNNV